MFQGGNGIFAQRSGPWKLVQSKGTAANSAPRDEIYNLAAAQPERVKPMNELLEKHSTEGRSTPGAPRKYDHEVRRYPAVKANASKAAE